ncbi:hypothetical protein ACWDKQ_29170 [Saccharopolyspora sp. NPDC000995]
MGKDDLAHAAGLFRAMVRTRRGGTQICYSLEPGALEVARRMSASLIPVS